MKQVKEVTNMILKCMTGIILVELVTGKNIDLLKEDN